jgi:hypothetical protein
MKNNSKQEEYDMEFEEKPGDRAYNLTKLWLDNVFEQIATSTTNTKFRSRPILIEIDVQQLDEINYNSTQYLIELIKSEIETSFVLFSDQLQILFICFYAILILLGVCSNSFVIYAFCRSKHLRTYRNIFIINLAIR